LNTRFKRWAHVIDARCSAGVWFSSAVVSALLLRRSSGVTSAAKSPMPPAPTLRAHPTRSWAAHCLPSKTMFGKNGVTLIWANTMNGSSIDQQPERATTLLPSRA